jgi:hypothetical protein
MNEVENLTDWRGKTLFDRDGQKIGKLEDVYVDTDNDEPMFGSVKEGLFSKHLTFVPLVGASASPDGLTVAVLSAQVRDAPTIAQGGELAGEEESQLYHYYGVNYTPPATTSARRLAKR